MAMTQTRLVPVPKTKRTEKPVRSPGKSPEKKKTKARTLTGNDDESTEDDMMDIEIVAIKPAPVLPPALSSEEDSLDSSSDGSFLDPDSTLRTFRNSIRPKPAPSSEEDPSDAKNLKEKSEKAPKPEVDVT